MATVDQAYDAWTKVYQLVLRDLVKTEEVSISIETIEDYFEDKITPIGTV